MGVTDVFRPIPLQCSHWSGGFGNRHHTRCTEEAVAWLTNPDGELNPGGYVCWEHGAAALGEYAEKLGEQWGAVTLHTVEQRRLRGS